ncbi:isochorismatase family cysteine hydrolase [Paenibacillus sp. MMS20-IR301]|uniref:cysteine hydrolase family protein n=1 Tax=Paenibacillus sp. MMS20-IR301 TaxID=2895946 RepID=UPI0028E78C11|nr:isochorismatase family cysteine hydrolase [Paenibacillus sp. MMS20-IR301]WNS42911.1 isochorismatase family cysteine hydrolase [Paenibacillus sp. MMS20-IR301]
MKIGFLIIDLQEVHLGKVEQRAIDTACKYINHVSELLRSKNHTVIHIQDIEGMQAGDEAKFEVISGIQIADTDLRVTKEYSNAFWKTNLEELVREQGIDLLILSGYAAEYCVLFTYNGAEERGFKPVLLQNGILSSKSDVIPAAYRDRNLISYPVVEALVQG